MIPYGRQSVSQQDIDAVVEALRSDWLTTGPKVEAFERAFADFVGAKHAVAVCNGTAGLHLAMLASDVRPGDRVITSPNTFLASANCAAFVGAIPDFADIDSVTLTLSASALEDQWIDGTQAVVAVHYAGQTADMPAIYQTAHSRGAVVIEDACHAVGGRFWHDDEFSPVGGHPWADMSVFSFHPVKTMTTGEGGMLVTDNDHFAERARLLRNHGIERHSTSFEGLGQSGALGEQGPWYYEMQSLGFNYRITDIQCALGLSQLRRLRGSIERRREIVRQYNSAFSDLPGVTTPRMRDERDAEHTSWHLYTAMIDFPMLGRTRSTVMQELKERDVGTQVLYIPVYLQPWYQRTFGYAPGKCPVAEACYQRSLSLPLFAAMTDKDVRHVINAFRGVIGRAYDRLEATP